MRCFTTDKLCRICLSAALTVGLLSGSPALAEPPGLSGGSRAIGEEIAVSRHLRDGEEFAVGTAALIVHGQQLFTAMWTIQEGAGRPLTKGTGAPLSDVQAPLVFPRNFNRVSAPDANSCAGCHNSPFGIAGGGGDVVANAFVLGQRFDFATFDMVDSVPTRGAIDERGAPVLLQDVANERSTLGLFGSGYIEMLARQISADLQAQRDLLRPGTSASLSSKGIGFGVLARRADGSWDTSGVSGLPAASLVSSGPGSPPDLIIRPFHQAGRVVSLREFTNNAFNHHHGIQSTERFGAGTDPDGDGHVNEITRADVTAAVIFQATLAVPGRVIPDDPEIEAAVLNGEQLFTDIGCGRCHVPQLPLDDAGWIFTEPNPFNPRGNLQAGSVPSFAVDLTSPDLPAPRLKREGSVVWVPAFTDFRLHDICAGPDDPNVEPLDMQHSPGSASFFAGNTRFITRKLWGAANEGPYFHHGKFTTMREAILAHAGDAQAEKDNFVALGEYDQGSIIEFLRTLQVLPPGTRHLVVNERYQPKRWPPPARFAGP